MILTFLTTKRQAYVNPENVAIATEEEYTDEKTSELIKFTRI